MRVCVTKWGNSLALRIPDTMAIEAGLEPGSYVDISLVDGKLIILPLTEPRLEDLIAGVTEDNAHSEVDTGSAVGNEVW